MVMLTFFVPYDLNGMGRLSKNSLWRVGKFMGMFIASYHRRHHRRHTRRLSRRRPYLSGPDCTLSRSCLMLFYLYRIRPHI